MKQFDIFTNNNFNHLNLPIISVNSIIHHDVSRFKDAEFVEINDGKYYLDNIWQYIVILNKRIIYRINFSNPSSYYPDHIWINYFETNFIKHYIYKQETKSINLVCKIPLIDNTYAYKYIDMLEHYKKYIDEPFEIVVENKIPKLKNIKDQIQKIEIEM